MARRIAAVLMLSWIAAPCLAQEPALPPFACAGYAVDITIDKEPPLKFVALERQPPLASSAHQFEFTKAASGLVSVHTLATVPEEFGRGSDARLVIYAQTAASIADLQDGRSQVPTRTIGRTPGSCSTSVCPRRESWSAPIATTTKAAAPAPLSIPG